MIEDANQQILLYLPKDFKRKEETRIHVSSFERDLIRKSKIFDVIDH
jgi:hypothetical protein